VLFGRGVSFGNDEKEKLMFLEGSSEFRMLVVIIVDDIDDVDDGNYFVTSLVVDVY